LEGSISYQHVVFEEPEEDKTAVPKAAGFSTTLIVCTGKNPKQQLL